MEAVAFELNTTIDKHLPALQFIKESEYSFKPSPIKWSKKEILGHLIDSAQNNIRRFIVAQYESRPKIVYTQDKWVSITNYQDYNLPDLISLWYLLNQHLCHLLKSLPEGMEEKECMTEESHTIKWLAQDYIKHLLHHLNQILNLEPVAYP
ncbi:MAG TPA: DinB family protein [Chitinophagaceae bacterium]